MPDGRQIVRFGTDDLAEAIRSGQLSLVYQPKIGLASNDLDGVEALARWHHPILGSIPPAEFVAAAESNELIDPLTLWVVETATSDWAAWRRAGLTINVAVNVSARNLGRIDFPDTIDAICARNGMPRRHLTVELTESTTHDLIHLLDTLARLRIKGVKVSLDDFGTGFSSLDRLRRLPFSEIKIDRSFVTFADQSEHKRAMVRHALAVADELGLPVVAEGVETEAVRHMLAELGCATGQGFLFSRPISAADLPGWARRWAGCA